MSIIGQNILAGASGGGDFTIEQSLRFNSTNSTADDAELHRTPGSASNRKTWTFSFWMKRGYKNQAGTIFGNASNMDKLAFHDNYMAFLLNNGTYSIHTSTTMFLRDYAAWYHIMFVLDTPQATAADRMKMYVNGVEPPYASTTYPTQDYEAGVNNNVAQYIGTVAASGEWYDGLAAEMHLVDGLALTPSSFGEVSADTGQWVPIKYGGTYGTNGFYMKFENSADFGNDSSGNGNDYTSSNLPAMDQMLDSPSNSFATFEPGIKPSNRGGQTIDECNMQIDVGADYTACAGTHPLPSTGKWYWEIYWTAMTAAHIGIAGTNANRMFSSDGTPQSGDSQILYVNSGNKNIDGTESAYGDGYLNNEIIGMAVNMDDSEITFYNEGVSQGAISFSGGITSARSGISIVPAFVIYGATIQVNFGQDGTFAGQKTAQGNSDANSIGNFYYTVPTGYLALCTSNFPEPTIINGGEHMNSLIWSGNDATGRAMTGLGFKPDMVWLKQLNGTEQYNEYDSIRGPTKFLATNDNTAEGTLVQGVTAFDSDGWTMGSDTANNGSGKTYAGWNWKGDGVAGGTANTDGTINTVVNVNSAAGFSIVGFTGTAANGTFGHGLSVAPDLVVVKNRSTNTGWIFGADVAYMQNDRNYYMQWNSNAAAATSTGLWNSIAPTATTVSIGGDTDVNGSGDDMIAYCWHSVEGYSRFAQYVGNANADGTFIYTGFRPQYVYVKRMNATPEWYLSDGARDPYNLVDGLLLLEGTNAEQDPFTLWDYVSNGIKLRSSDGAFNGNGDQMIAVAFAESPLKYSNAH